MKKFRIYVTLPVYFYAEVDAENADDALDKFDFADATEDADYRLRYATYIETQELDDNDKVVDVIVHEDLSLEQIEKINEIIYANDEYVTSLNEQIEVLRAGGEVNKELINKMKWLM